MPEYVGKPGEGYMEKPCDKKPEHKCSEDECVKTAYQYANVSVPMEIKPTTKIEDIEVECCAEPVVECCEDKCHNSCEITVKQKLCIKIPIQYKIKVCAEEGEIKCDSCDKCDK